MEVLLGFLSKFFEMLQTPTLAFLILGMLVAAVKSELRIPDAVYQFTVFVLLMRIGLNAGMEMRNADISAILLPALICVVIGIVVVLVGSAILTRLPGVKPVDAIATTGLFGAVSSGTFIAGTLALEDAGIAFEGWVAALYPFMDTPALVTAIVLANLHLKKKSGTTQKVSILAITKETFQGMAVTTLFAGILVGLLAQPSAVFEGFYDQLFIGFLSVLMLTLGMDAYSSLRDLFKVAHWYALYAAVAPLVHGLAGFGLGYIAHLLVGFSPGGVIMLAILASSNSDVSGPPTLRSGIPSANPSAYIGSSTGVGTPVAIGIGIPLFMYLGKVVFGI